MDLITHAIVGGMTGAVFQRPWLGALIAVLPDWPLWLRRRPRRPPDNYYKSHSLLFGWGGCAAVWLAWRDVPGVVQTVALAWLSHLVLDFVTHGHTWAPRLLHPFSSARPRSFEEWEWGNRSWWGGFWLAYLWSIVCVQILNAA